VAHQPSTREGTLVWCTKSSGRNTSDSRRLPPKSQQEMAGRWRHRGSFSPGTLPGWGLLHLSSGDGTTAERRNSPQMLPGKSQRVGPGWWRVNGSPPLLPPSCLPSPVTVLSVRRSLFIYTLRNRHSGEILVLWLILELARSKGVRRLEQAGPVTIGTGHSPTKRLSSDSLSPDALLRPPLTPAWGHSGSVRLGGGFRRLPCPGRPGQR
jgi:hypothetical protein